MTKEQKEIISNELNLGMKECDYLKDCHIHLQGKFDELNAYFEQLRLIRAHFGFALKALEEFENDNSCEESSIKINSNMPESNNKATSNEILEEETPFK